LDLMFASFSDASDDDSGECRTLGTAEMDPFTIELPSELPVPLDELRDKLQELSCVKFLHMRQIMQRKEERVIVSAVGTIESVHKLRGLLSVQPAVSSFPNCQENGKAISRHILPRFEKLGICEIESENESAADSGEDELVENKSVSVQDEGRVTEKEDAFAHNEVVIEKEDAAAVDEGRVDENENKYAAAHDEGKVVENKDAAAAVDEGTVAENENAAAYDEHEVVKNEGVAAHDVDNVAENQVAAAHDEDKVAAKEEAAAGDKGMNFVGCRVIM
uniref:Ski_Sno domain-containing protein n=1 Tax=Gongylonema pulchrum TaxID=637853 RepID=A0A183D076_9BILA